MTEDELNKSIIRLHSYKKKVGWILFGVKCVFCDKYFKRIGQPLEKHLETCEMQDARKYRIQRWQEILSLGKQRPTLHKKE